MVVRAVCAISIVPFCSSVHHAEGGHQLTGCMHRHFEFAAGQSAYLFSQTFLALPKMVSSDLGKLEARRQRTVAWA